MICRELLNKNQHWSDAVMSRRIMGRHSRHWKLQLIIQGLILLWGIFSYAYAGVEDGSSGLSPPGWINTVFFIPGLILIAVLKGSYSNADLPLAALAGLIFYSLAATGLTQGIFVLFKPRKKKSERKAAANSE